MAQISSYYTDHVFVITVIDKSLYYVYYNPVGNKKNIKDRFDEFVKCFNLHNSALPKENVDIIGYFTPYPEYMANIKYTIQTELNKVKKLQQARYKSEHIELYYDKNYGIENVQKNIDQIKKMYEKSYSNLNVTFTFYLLDYNNIGSDLYGRQFIDSCGGAHKLPQNIFKIKPLVQKGGE